MDYLASNKAYWEKGYHAVNVDHAAFRFYGRILKPQFGLTGEGHERFVEFGCGQGAAANYFSNLGFDVRAVDISETDIGIAKIRYPHIAPRFSVCNPKPASNPFYGFADDVSVVTAFQSLYYFSDRDFTEVMDKIHRSMRKGGVFFATMMGEQSKEFFGASEPAADGLRVVNFRNQRIDVKGYYMFFIKDEEHLKRKFSMFKPVHTGYYAAKLRSDEGDGFHHTFCGIKE